MDEGVHTSKRQEIKELIRELKQINPNVDMNIFRSAENVNLDACIGYVKDGKRHRFTEDIRENEIFIDAQKRFLPVLEKCMPAEPRKY